MTKRETRYSVQCVNVNRPRTNDSAVLLCIYVCVYLYVFVSVVCVLYVVQLSYIAPCANIAIYIAL